MSNFDKIVSLLSEILGEGVLKKKGEVVFYCPECQHRKRKLSVNIHTERWHCWICEGSKSVKGKKLRTLLQRFNASREQFNRLRELVKDSTPYFVKESTKILTLPKDFISLRDESDSFFYRNAINYIKNRELTSDDILKYNIGYCEDGKYRNRVILPSYNKDGKLNYFTARSWFKDSQMPYLNPDISKDIVGFEFFINWRLPIVIVEGWFDAAAVKRNVIPLFGKTIQTTLQMAIVEHDVQDIYLALDGDALKNSIRIAEKFMKEERSVYVVRLENEDPAELGLGRFFNKLYNTKKMTFYDLVKLKIEVGV